MTNPTQQDELQRPSAEVLYADELKILIQQDGDDPRPEGWLLTPRSVLKFVLGDKKLKIEPKFVGERSFIERCIVALATNRGLMMIGEPGTAKSYLSELLAAAISGDSTLTVQGSAGTTEDNIKYSWNYSLLLAEGPSERSLIRAPLFTGMQTGKIVRFEEITRCPVEVQDTMLSILSDRVMIVPELDGDMRTLYARKGFNVIATANTRDRGVNDMSAALKRRFNFETVRPIADRAFEAELIARALDAELGEHRLLCAHRDGPWGVAPWNDRVERWLAEASDHLGRQVVGRPLLVTTNDRGLGLFNGDTGVMALRADHRVVGVFGEPDAPIVHAASTLGEVDTAHALTIHKSQGSQARSVTVLLPDADSRLLTRELLYTAITRAQESVTLVGSEAAVRAAVERRTQRATGLRHRV